VGGSFMLMSFLLVELGFGELDPNPSLAEH
jgi:hypothetical protein